MDKRVQGFVKFSRRQRRRAMRDMIQASYDAAGADPEFQADMQEFNAVYDVTVGDGLSESAADEEPRDRE
jgi:hypothetical protein